MAEEVPGRVGFLPASCCFWRKFVQFLWVHFPTPYLFVTDTDTFLFLCPQYYLPTAKSVNVFLYRNLVEMLLSEIVVTFEPKCTVCDSNFGTFQFLLREEEFAGLVVTVWKPIAITGIDQRSQKLFFIIWNKPLCYVYQKKTTHQPQQYDHWLLEDINICLEAVSRTPWTLGGQTWGMMKASLWLTALLTEKSVLEDVWVHYKLGQTSLCIYISSSVSYYQWTSITI